MPTCLMVVEGDRLVVDVDAGGDLRVPAEDLAVHDQLLGAEGGGGAEQTGSAGHIGARRGRAERGERVLLAGLPVGLVAGRAQAAGDERQADVGRELGGGELEERRRRAGRRQAGGRRVGDVEERRAGDRGLDGRAAGEHAGVVADEDGAEVG